jgi:signal transduction histidine kinase
MIRLFTYSLSLRLLAIFLLLAALFAWGVVAGIRWVYSEDDLRSVISGHLSLHVDYVRKDIGSPPRFDRALAITRRVPVDIHISGPGVNWSSDPAFPDPATMTFGPSDYFSSRPDALLDELKGVDFAQRDNHRYLRFHEGDYQIVVVTPKIAQHSSRPPLIPALVCFAVLLVLLAYLAVRGLFRPLSTIRSGAAYIGAGNFAHRIKAGRDDELGALADDINRMAGKVEGMLDAKQQLLLGVSHELRSPLSRINLGLAMLDDTGPVRDIRHDVDEMRAIIQTLLDAERLGARHAVLNLADVSLHDIMRELQERYFHNETRLVTTVEQTRPVRLDGARILLMLKNLIGNALRYSRPEDGPVEVVVRVGDQAVHISVRDHGPGVPADQREHLGEPFYRADSSRTRDTGSIGLGLYLARQVARAHGGDLLLAEPPDGRGALFVIRLPIDQPT